MIGKIRASQPWADLEFRVDTTPFLIYQSMLSSILLCAVLLDPRMIQPQQKIFLCFNEKNNAYQIYVCMHNTK